MRANLTIVVMLLLALAPAARGQTADSAEQRSLAHYQKGVTAYDLGKFDEAVEEFQKAYEIRPTAAYLYNIAQAYRQKGDAARAVFFYRRYLQKAPDAKNREVVEKRIGELEELARKQEESKSSPPNSLEGDKGETSEPAPAPASAEPPPAPVAAAPASPAVGADDTAAEVTAAAPRGQSVALLSIEAGPAFVALGDGPSVPVQVSLRAGAAYTLHLGGVALDLGAAATLTPLPFETLERTSSGTAMLIGALANAGARLAVARKLSLRGELGAGVAVFTGLANRNPFTDAGAESGAVLLPHVRVAGGLDYALSPSLLITVTPAFAWSSGHDSLDDRISAITRLDVLLGVGYIL
jgi:tetratricopeptide (TPR) repeat protein